MKTLQKKIGKTKSLNYIGKLSISSITNGYNRFKTKTRETVSVTSKFFICEG